MSGHSLAIVGATGAVGLKLLQVIDERVKEVKNLRLFASSRSAGQKFTFRGKEITVEDVAKSDFKGVDVAFFSAGTEASLQYCPKAVKDGAIVIDNTNAHRMNKDVPLIVPEANFHALKKEHRLIANPNCSTIQMIVALAPIHRANPIKRIVVSTYQSVSGTGLEAIDILKKQSKAILEGTEIPQVSTAYDACPRSTQRPAVQLPSARDRYTPLGWLLVRQATDIRRCLSTLLELYHRCCLSLLCPGYRHSRLSAVCRKHRSWQSLALP